MRAMITAVSHYVPEQVLTNADLAKMVDTSDEWITSRTGIKERRILDRNLGTSYMATHAAQNVLTQRGVSARELDLLIVATVTPDTFVPTAAALIQKRLGADNCGGFDINGGCSGFLCALTTGALFVESGRFRKVMVVGADTMSAFINFEDRNTSVLFGDGAGAVLLEPTTDPELGIEDFELHLNGDGAPYLHIPAGGSLQPASHDTVDRKLHYVHQDGKKVFKEAIKGMKTVAGSLLKKNGLTVQEIKLFIPHQANKRIIDAVANSLKLVGEQVCINIFKYGNTTSATIPLAMSEAYQNKMMQKGDRILLTAFGAGFTWGGVLLKWAI